MEFETTMEWTCTACSPQTGASILYYIYVAILSDRIKNVQPINLCFMPSFEERYISAEPIIWYIT